MNYISQHKDIKILMKDGRICETNYPHFQVDYRGLIAKFSFDLSLVEGRLPVDVMLYVLDWTQRHQDELSDNWKRLQKKELLMEINC
ncbi:MAG: DUF4160 domain-containing protein [Ignavibacteria bacterium]|nr:DUF4160 domain-containing protein [Bacteroidota bacterium]MBL7127666.1 DUF4160 domain-containing protein [Ignavibacteria bacterium]